MAQSRIFWIGAGRTLFRQRLRLNGTIKTELGSENFVRGSMHSKDNPAADLPIRVNVRLFGFVYREEASPPFWCHPLWGIRKRNLVASSGTKARTAKINKLRR